jgi:hypothetical protein
VCLPAGNHHIRNQLQDAYDLADRLDRLVVSDFAPVNARFYAAACLRDERGVASNAQSK